MGDDDEIQSDDKIHSGTERFSHFKMDDAFCERMRLAIERGLESAPIGVNTTPEPITPNSQRDMVPSSRRFPPPIEELNDACFIVSDASGQVALPFDVGLIARKLVLLVGHGIVSLSKTQIRCHVGGGHHLR